MITILVVGEPGEVEEIDRVASPKPSLEILHARDVEETLERLSRNRRIDAVLILLPADRVSEVAAVLREEDPTAPPLFAPEKPEGAPEVRALSGATVEELLEALTKQLSG